MGATHEVIERDCDHGDAEAVGSDVLGGGEAAQAPFFESKHGHDTNGAPRGDGASAVSDVDEFVAVSKARQTRLAPGSYDFD